MQRQVKLKNRLFAKAFTHVTAGDSPKREFYTRDGEVSELGASLSGTSLGKQRKESRIFFTPTFQKEESGFCCFTGYELRGVLWKK